MVTSCKKIKMTRKTKTQIWRNNVAENLIWCLICTCCFCAFWQQASFVVAADIVGNAPSTDEIRPEDDAMFEFKSKLFGKENENTVDDCSCESTPVCPLDSNTMTYGADRRFGWMVGKLFRLGTKQYYLKLNLESTRKERDDLRNALKRSKQLEKQKSGDAILLREAVALSAMEKIKLRRDVSKWRRRTFQFKKLLLKSSSQSRKEDSSSSDSNDFWGSLSHQISVCFLLIAFSHYLANIISFPYSKSKEIQTDPISEIVPLNLCNDSFNFSRLTKPTKSETVDTKFQTEDANIDTMTNSDGTGTYAKTINTPFNLSDVTQERVPVDLNSNDDTNHNQTNSNAIQVTECSTMSSQTEYLDMMVISRENKVKIDKFPPTKYWKELREKQRQQWNLCLVNVINSDAFVKDACVETEVTSTTSCQTDEMPYNVVDKYIQERFLHDLTFNRQKGQLYDDGSTEKLEDIEFWNADDVKSLWSASSLRSSRSRFGSQSSVASEQKICGTPDKLSHKSLDDSAVDLSDDINSLRSRASSPDGATTCRSQTDIMEVRLRPKQNRRRSFQELGNRDSAISMTFTDCESNLSGSCIDLTRSANFESLVERSTQTDRNGPYVAHARVKPEEEYHVSTEDNVDGNISSISGYNSNIPEVKLPTNSVALCERLGQQYDKTRGRLTSPHINPIQSRDIGTQCQDREMKATTDCGIQCFKETADVSIQYSPDVTGVGSQHEKYWLSQGTQSGSGGIQNDENDVYTAFNERNESVSKATLLEERDIKNITSTDTTEHNGVKNETCDLRALNSTGSPEVVLKPVQVENSDNGDGVGLSSVEVTDQVGCYDKRVWANINEGCIDSGQSNKHRNRENNSTYINTNLKACNGTIREIQEKEDNVNEKEDMCSESDEPSKAFTRENLQNILEKSFPDVNKSGLLLPIVNYAMSLSPKFNAENIQQDIATNEGSENHIVTKTGEVENLEYTETGVQTDKIPWLASQPLEYPRMSQIIRVVRPTAPSVFQLASYRPVRF